MRAIDTFREMKADRRGALVCQECAVPQSMFYTLPGAPPEEELDDDTPCLPCPACGADEALVLVCPTVASAVVVLHDALKPENRVKLVDLGVAGMLRVALKLAL